MSAHEYPNTLAITYAGAGVTSQYLNWDLMKEHTLDACGSGCTSSSHTMLARLCREIGEQAQASYGDNGTSVSFYNIPSAFNNLGYTYSGPIAINESTIKSNIDNEQPVYMRGERYDDGKIKGHAWVVDGYKYIRNTYLVYKREVGTTLWFPTGYVNYTYEQTDYIHCNWGWSGLGNGYFLYNVFNFYDDDVIYDYSGQNPPNKNYTMSLMMIYNIEPDI